MHGISHVKTGAVFSVRYELYVYMLAVYISLSKETELYKTPITVPQCDFRPFSRANVTLPFHF